MVKVLKSFPQNFFTPHPNMAIAVALPCAASCRVAPELIKPRDSIHKRQIEICRTPSSSLIPHKLRSLAPLCRIGPMRLVTVFIHSVRVALAGADLLWKKVLWLAGWWLVWYERKILLAWCWFRMASHILGTFCTQNLFLCSIKSTEPPRSWSWTLKYYTLPMLMAPHADFFGVVLTAKQIETLKGNKKWLENKESLPSACQLPAPTSARVKKRPTGFGNRKGTDQISGATSRERH